MIGVRHLSNAPVKEALIAFQFSAEWMRELSSVCVELAGADGRLSDLLETDLQIKLDSAASPQLEPLSSSRIGKRIDFDELKQVLQVQRDSFTFSQLEPYSNWENMLAQAYSSWKTISSALTGVEISRMTVRYINAIDLPIPDLNFEDYLNASPSVPEGLPQGLSQFLIKTVSPVEDDIVIVTQSLTEVVDNKARVVLDIDTSCLKKTELTEESFIKTLSRLRDRKNKVFFSYLTEKTLEMYK